MENHPRFTDEPLTQWDLDSFNRLLAWAYDLGASDINMIPGDGVWIRLHGDWFQVTRRPVTPNEPAIILDQITRTSSSSARVLGGDYQDLAHEIKVGRNERIYFRVNATGCRYQWTVGTNLVLRTIPGIPPKLETLNVQQGILDHCFPENGLVLLTGVMGSGKSTLIAAMLRWIIENQRRFVATFEAPIEFDLRAIPNRKSPVVQSTVADELSGGSGFANIRSFADAPRNSTRRACNVILVGESRDPVTLRGMIEIAEIGVAAYSTVHTSSVAETPSRIINVFRYDAQNQIAATLLSSLRLIVHQRLVPKVGGGRTAIREYLAFDEEVREDLLRNMETHSLIPRIRQWLMRRWKEDGEDNPAARGLPLYEDAKRQYRQGLIPEKVYVSIMKEFSQEV